MGKRINELLGNTINLFQTIFQNHDTKIDHLGESTAKGISISSKDTPPC
jgi:hypothetical protein